MLYSANESLKRISNEKGQRNGKRMVGVEKDDDMGGNLHLDGLFGGWKDILTFVWDIQQNVIMIHSVWTL